MTSQSRSSSRLLILIILAAALGFVAARGGVRSEQGTDGAAPPPTDRPSTVVLAAGEACLDVGYLCATLEEADSMRILRWPDRVRSLLVVVPEPPGLEQRLARELRRAAIRGVLRWQDTPLRIQIAGEAGTSDADVVVSWTGALPDRRLGVTRTQWYEEGVVATFRVTGLDLATISPATGRTPTADEVELTAAHEFGHALGLPHSNDDKDLMYPENTARFLTNRDYRTALGLYRQPNGALIRR